MGKARPPAGDGRRPPRQRGGADLADAHAVAASSGGGGQERRGGLEERSGGGGRWTGGVWSWRVADRVHSVLDIYISG
jgi:hypothetical protein